MKGFMPVLFLIAAGLMVLTGGGTFISGESRKTIDSLKIRQQLGESPVLSAAQSIAAMELEDGFEVRLVAEEPLINSPVAMVFDMKGRIWVAEMEGYMPDTAGTGEDKPVGRIVILSDSNRDGIMDRRHIFLDSLVLPRALCFVEGGILIAEPPRLWFYQISDDKPSGRVLVDAAYAEGGNVEHQPNGLLRALDNWIYNAKSDKRYRLQNGRWLIERTHFRGQWGISQDDQGRLVYNTNSENLIGDLFSPGFGAVNTNQKTVSGFNKNLVSNNRVYPARPTPGVNRGYLEGILDDSLRLVNFTAACGPVIYNGDLFGKSWYGNAFVAEPSANLIKRNLITTEGYRISGRQAYTGKEFLRSTDERFRPVNLYNGPDGALYIVDMYRGIIQHKTYLTPYLKNEIRERSLTMPLNCGRIYKVVPSGKKVRSVRLPDRPSAMISLLGSPNGWVRMMIQQQLIDRKDISAAPALRKLIRSSSRQLAVLHSLWTLEGLGLLTHEDVLPLFTHADPMLRAQGFALSGSVIAPENYRKFLPVFEQVIRNNDASLAPLVAFTMPSISKIDRNAAADILTLLSRQFPDDIYVADAVISNLKDRENEFYQAGISYRPDTSSIFNKRLRTVLEDIDKAKNSRPDPSAEFPRGSAIYRTFCQTCHGADGNGVPALAPPLNNSEWVTGDKNKLAAIVLYGLTGPVKVGNKIYRSPEIAGDMPGIASNKDFTDADIASLLSYIRNSWTNKADRAEAREVTAVRQQFKAREKPFTAEELNQ